MKAIRISRTGGPEVLEYVDIPTPVAAPNEVLIKAHAIGVNMPEVLVRRGTYAWMPPLPAIVEAKSEQAVSLRHGCPHEHGAVVAVILLTWLQPRLRLRTSGRGGNGWFGASEPARPGP